MRLADVIVDDLGMPLERQRFIRETGRYLAGELNTYDYSDSVCGEAVHKLRFALTGFSLDVRAAFAKNAGVYFRAMEFCRQAKDIKDYIFYRKLEGQITSNFFSIVLSDSIPSNQRSKCIRWFKQAGRVAHCFDSFVDLEDDFKEGEVVVNPSIRNRLFLLGASVNDGTHLLYKCGIGHLFPLLQVCVYTLQNCLREQPEQKLKETHSIN